MDSEIYHKKNNLAARRKLWGKKSSTTTSGQRGPGSNGNEGVLRIPQSSCITICLRSYPRHSLRESYSSAEMQLMYSTPPDDWAEKFLLSWLMSSCHGDASHFVLDIIKGQSLAKKCRFTVFEKNTSEVMSNFENKNISVYGLEGQRFWKWGGIVDDASGCDSAKRIYTWDFLQQDFNTTKWKYCQSKTLGRYLI